MKKELWEYQPSDGIASANRIKRFPWGILFYNPDTGSSEVGIMFTNLARSLGQPVRDGEETAIYDKVNRVYYILEGDFREELDECTTLEECLDVYHKYPEYRSEWSTDD